MKPSNLVLLLAGFLVACALLSLGLLLVASSMGEAFVYVDGAVRGEWGSPIEGAAVRLSSPGNTRPGCGTTSSVDGRFSLRLSFGGWEGLGANKRGFVLRVEKEGFVPVERQVADGETVSVFLLPNAEPQ
jgi:hypothetical protein